MLLEQTVTNGRITTDQKGAKLAQLASRLDEVIHASWPDKQAPRRQLLPDNAGLPRGSERITEPAVNNGPRDARDRAIVTAFPMAEHNRPTLLGAVDCPYVRCATCLRIGCPRCCRLLPLVRFRTAHSAPNLVPGCLFARA